MVCAIVICGSTARPCGSSADGHEVLAKRPIVVFLAILMDYETNTSVGRAPGLFKVVTRWTVIADFVVRFHWYLLKKLTFVSLQLVS